MAPIIILWHRDKTAGGGHLEQAGHMGLRREGRPAPIPMCMGGVWVQNILMVSRTALLGAGLAFFRKKTWFWGVPNGVSKAKQGKMAVFL